MTLSVKTPLGWHYNNKRTVKFCCSTFALESHPPAPLVCRYFAHPEVRIWIKEWGKKPKSQTQPRQSGRPLWSPPPSPVSPLSRLCWLRIAGGVERFVNQPRFVQILWTEAPELVWLLTESVWRAARTRCRGTGARCCLAEGHRRAASLLLQTALTLLLHLSTL